MSKDVGCGQFSVTLTVHVRGQGYVHQHPEVTEDPLGKDNGAAFIPFLTVMSKYLTRAREGRKELFWLTSEEYSRHGTVTPSTMAAEA